MGLLFDSFWRAAAYCLHPRVIALSFLPLVVMVVVAGGAAWLWWDPAVAGVFRWLESYELFARIGDWLRGVGMDRLANVLAPLVLVLLATPVIAIGSIVAVAVLMAPALVRLVGERRFPALQKKRGGSVAASIAWSLGSSVVALAAMVLSLPLWLIPPLILVIPPLIWGWLTYRVMAFDALAEHAGAEERREIFRRHRWHLLGIGVVTGYMGAAPSIVWASGALFVAAFVVLIPVAIWIYTMVFAFSSLWFAHYCLAALAATRSEPVASRDELPR